MKEYSPTDFPEVQCSVVENLSEPVGNLVKAKLATERGVPLPNTTDIASDAGLVSFTKPFIVFCIKGKIL